MSNSYYVTAHKPTAVHSCLTGNFSCDDHLNLITARGNRLCIEYVTDEGLSTFKELNINGRIAVVKLFRQRGETKDSLFLITARYNAMILACEHIDDHYKICTKAQGNVSDAVGKPSENGISAIIDPLARVIGLRLYDGLFKIIALDKNNTELKATNIRMDELQLQDVQFLHGCSNPTIILIHQDTHGRHVKTYEISVRDKEFIRSPWTHNNVESEAEMIIPVETPICGALIIGHETILYNDGITSLAVTASCFKASTIINCYTRLGDCYRYLLGDVNGYLYALQIVTEKRDFMLVVKDIVIYRLGEISIPECLTYLDNGVIYVGSIFGNSQLIRLSTSNIEDECTITVLQTFSNLAPIVDMCVVDLEKQGQEQLVTCSGAFKEGALKIIRNGIGIHENAIIELTGIKGMWSIVLGEVSSEHTLHNTLVISFVEKTRILQLIGEEVEVMEYDSFDLNKKTYFCANVAFNQVVQVTPCSIRLINQLTKKLVYEWMSNSVRNISIATGNEFQIVCSMGAELFYFEIQEHIIVVAGKCVLNFEISCLDISPFLDKQRSDFVALGLWTDLSIKILKVPELTEVHYEVLGGEISRSILMVSLEEVNYLLCTIGDGTLFYFRFLKNGKLSDRKKVTLALQPTILKVLRSLNSTNVFACSDRPAVIHSSNRKLLFSNVNVKEVNHMCSLNAESYPESLVLATENLVIIGTIDEIQKLHIRSIPLYETPRRIVYQETNSCFAVITTRFDLQTANGLIPIRPSASTTSLSTSASSSSSFTLKQTSTSSASNQPALEMGQEIEINNLLIIDQITFDVIHTHQFCVTEYALSIVSCSLADDPNVYFIVGTAFISNDESESKSGRILIFNWLDGKLVQVAEKEIKGACYYLVEFNGKLLAAINSTVRLFEWTKEKELRLECSHFNHIVALYLKTKDDFVLIGDLMRSMTLLQYKALEGAFEEVARDHNPNWITAIEFINDDLYLASENSMNLIVCQKDSTAINEEERQLMHDVGLFHLGEPVNVFRHGSLVIPNLGETSAVTSNNILMGTVNGGIGLLTQLKPNLFDILLKLQQIMSKYIITIGKIQHEFWRSFQNEHKTESCTGFIDGDLIESFLDLPIKFQNQIIDQMKENDAEDDPHLHDKIVKIIEDLTRIH